MPKAKSPDTQNTQATKPRRRKAIPRHKARRVRTPYDAIYKLVFSFLEVMADFLREYIPVTGPLRYETLERFPDTYINRELRERREDLIWRVQSCHGEWCYIYILTEFQSRNDPLMAIRIAEYVTVFLHGLYRSGVLKPGDTLPLAVPVVLHNGLDTWTAPLSLSDMAIPVAEPLYRFQPQQAYFQLDVKTIPQDKLAKKSCLPTLLFRMERMRNPDELREVVHDANARMAGPQYEELRCIFGQWAMHLAKRVGIVDKNLPEIVDLKEVGTMIETTCLHWKDQYIEQGKRDGEKKGKEDAYTSVVRNLLTMDMNEDMIIRATGLPREDVRRMAAAAVQATSPNTTTQPVGVSPVL